MSKSHAHFTVIATVLTGVLVIPPTMAEFKAEPSQLPPDVRKEARACVERGLKFLAARQDGSGGWTSQHGPAVTAIVAHAFARDPAYGRDHAIVKRAHANVLKHQQDDGGIYDRGQNLANYHTSVVLMFLSYLDKKKDSVEIARAQKFLTGLQFDEKEKIDSDNPWYGGAGYNTTKRPDLSNTQMMLEALHQSGLPKDDPVYQRALLFVSRCQMNGTTNDMKFARGSSDGGFIYSPHHQGESKASEEVLEGSIPLRSYGSMTYAGFKSMLYAGLSREDPRTVAALGWIRRNYTLDVNPGMPPAQKHQGLYYYFHVFAQAMKAWGEPVITDSAGTPHNWRLDLSRKLMALQRSDGSWLNEEDRWLEGDPNYVTAMTILSLQTAME